VRARQAIQVHGALKLMVDSWRVWRLENVETSPCARLQPGLRGHNPIYS
jgi:hypothetical protein